MKNSLLVALALGTTLSAAAQIPANFPQTLPDGYTGYRQVLTADEITIGNQYVIVAVNHATSWDNNSFLTATTIDDTPYARFLTLDSITAAGITTDKIFWTAAEPTASLSQKDNSSINFSLQDGDGNYFQTRHGSAAHNTATNQGALTFNTSSRNNYVYATKLVETPGVYGVFSIVAASNSNLDSDGAYYNIWINANSNETVTELKTKLSVNKYVDGDGSMEICAGSGGNNWTESVQTSYFVVYQVLTYVFDKDAAEEELAEYKESTGYLDAIEGLFTEEEIAAEYAKITIEESDDYVTELAEKKHAFDELQIAAVINKLDGKKIFLRNLISNNGHDSSPDYIYGTDDTGNLPHYTAKDARAIWTVGMVDDQKITLYNDVYQAYANDLTMNATAGNYQLSNTRHDDYFLIKVDTRNGGSPYWHQAQNTLTNWSATDGSMWQISLVTDNDEAELTASLTSAYDELAAKEEGIGLNKYTVTPENGLNTLNSKIEDISSASDKVDAAIDAARFCYVTLQVSLNMPEAGKFYRFKGAYNTGTLQQYVVLYYTTNTGSNATASHAANKGMTVDNTYAGYEDSHSIHYYDGSHLLSYSHGYHLVSDSDGYAKFATDPSDNEGAEVGFAEGYSVNATYQIVHEAQDGTYKSLFINGSGSPKWYLTFANVGSLNTTYSNQQSNWFAEEITELPVALDASGFGTFVAPVATQLPEGVIAYNVTLDKETAIANYTKISDNIPANTPVLLQGTANTTINMTCLYDEPAAQSDEESASILEGSHIAKAVADGENVLVLGVNSDEKSAFVPATDNIVGVYITLSDDDTNTSYELADKPTTSITEVGVETTTASGAVYDLQGRRLSAPAKGINIINGQKVLVK